MWNSNREQEFDRLERARLELIQLVQRVIEAKLTEGVEVTAVEVVDAILLDRPDLVQMLAYPGPARAWYCPRASLALEDTPWFMRGGDEYGNDTVAFRVPFAGQVVVNTSFPMKRYARPLNEA